MEFPKVLVYSWNVADTGFVRGLKNIGIPYIIYDKPMRNYHADGEFAQDVVNLVVREKIDAVFSYDFFPLLSLMCEVRNIPYIAWIYDCPVYTMQSETLRNPCNYIFCFDRVYTERLSANGALNCFHFPLAGRRYLKEEIEKMQKIQPNLEEKYACNISFLGSLYNEQKNRLRYVELTPYSAGYVEGILKAQSAIYGQNFIKAALNERVTEEIADKCRLSLGELYDRDDLQMSADAIGMLLTNRERQEALQRLSELHEVEVYSGSEIPEILKGKNIVWKGYADHETEMPYIFYNSRINLNVTSRVIESGIPLRVFDILSCGGFCLTNYQPEIAEYFVDGQDLVMYSDMEEMCRKVDYYLNHEEERAAICRNGYEKITKEFDLENRIKQIFSMVFKGEWVV
jgi:spore maturation protein CgeB